MNTVNHSLLLNMSGAKRAARATTTCATSTSMPLAPMAVTPVPSEINLPALFRHVSVITVLGQIENWQLAWAGRISCTLRLSIGTIALFTNREKLPLEIQNGSWVTAKLMLPRGPASPTGQALLFESLEVKLQKNDPTTAWVPTVECTRQAHMVRLRKLLTRLEPGLQAIFMAVMVDARVQRGFFTRIAASDHHTYPGGMSDQSIEAAEIAYQSPAHLSAEQRGIAAMACILFDLGKISDDHYCPDRHRVRLGLSPHAMTARHLRQTLDKVARFDPTLVATLRSLFVPCDWTEWLSPPGIPPNLKQIVHQALHKSWGLEKPAGDYLTNFGEKA